MSKSDRARYAAYRDAVGMLSATRRGDEDAMAWFVVYQPSMRTSVFNGLLGVCLKLLREIDRLGGDADKVVRDLARIVAENETDRLDEESE